MKYTLEFKLDCVSKYKNGTYVDSPVGISRTSFLSHVRAWTRNYDDLGIDGLKHRNQCKVWTPSDRFALVAKVLAGHSMTSVALEAHIDASLLYQWVRRYNERGMNGLECKKGRKPKNIMKPKKTKLSVSEKEELKLLKERNEYLEMENAYLKKLDALVSKEEAAHPKAKKQKRSKN